MAHVVFVRAANVGGKNVFRPAQLAIALADLDVVNVGAAGTFVVRAKARPDAIRREIAARLGFTTEIAIVPDEDVLALVRLAPFKGVAFSKDLRGWVAALHGHPTASPKLPLLAPVGSAWSLRLDRVEGEFALGLWQRRPKLVFPSLFIEKSLGIAATTRWWETIERIAAILAKAPASPAAKKPRARR